MSFLPAIHADEQEEQADDLFRLGQPEDRDPDRHNDTRLQTLRGDEALQRLLTRMERDSKSVLEEQGVNTLYLALGFLHWKEAATTRSRRSPLLLVPLELQRPSVRERVSALWTGEELGPNLSLEQKLKHDFGVVLPTCPDLGSEAPSSYFDAVEKAVASQPDWRVEPNAIRVGFFSFTKFLMYRDLDPTSWPAGKGPVEHPILGGLIRGDMPSSDGPAPVSGQVDRAARDQDVVTILDADSSQTEALLRARQARVMVIQGPPGTGKSQTIANLIADAVMQEKKVLFVAEKLAALSVVKRRLQQSGLGDACLELHSRMAKKKEIIQDLARTWDLAPPRCVVIARRN